MLSLHDALPICHVELAADFARRIEQFDGVTTLGEHSRGREAGRAGTDDGDALPVRCRRVVQFGLMARARIDETARHLQLECVIEAGLIAGDAGRSEEHTSELQSLMRISYAVLCLKKKNYNNQHKDRNNKTRVNR